MKLPDLPEPVTKRLAEQTKQDETIAQYLITAIKAGLQLENTREVANQYDETHE